MLTWQFRKMYYTELLFLATVNDVKACPHILSANCSINRLPVKPTVVIHINETIG